MKNLLLIGGGGHCGSVLDSILSQNGFSRLGIIDTTDAPVLGVPVVGSDDDLPRLLREGWTDAFVTVGSTGDVALRRRLYEMIRRLGFRIPAIVDGAAVIARNVTLGEGCYVGKKAVVNTGAVLGRCAIVNTGAIVEHDCLIGDFVHISPGAVLCGQVTVGDDSHIGAGAVVRQQIQIGARALVGAGSVVVGNVPDHVTAYGNPCKVIQR